MTEQITTPEALDALPDQDVLLLASGHYPDGGNFSDCWVRPLPSWITGGEERVWEVLVYGAALKYTAVLTEHIDLPATILFRPDAPTPTPTVTEWGVQHPQGIRPEWTEQGARARADRENERESGRLWYQPRRRRVVVRREVTAWCPADAPTPRESSTAPHPTDDTRAGGKS